MNLKPTLLTFIFLLCQLNKAFNQSLEENKYLPISNILHLKWQVTTEKWDAFDDRPLLYEGILFLYANTDFAVDAKTGEKLYYADSEVQDLLRDKFKDSLLFFDTYKKAIVLDIYSGKKLLEIDKKTGVYNGYQTPNFLQSNFIITKENKNILSAYDITNKEKVWTFTTLNIIANKPLLKSDTILFCDKTKLYAIDMSSKNQLWNVDMGGAISSAMYIAKNFMYIWVENRGLLSFNLLKQEIAWVYNDFETQYGNYNLLFEGDTIFFANDHIYALNKNTGKLIWKSDEDCALKSNYITSISNYILYYDGCTNNETDIISAVEKQSGKKAYQGFTSALFPPDNPNNPNNLADIEYASFKFTNDSYDGLIFGIYKNGIYAFEVVK